MTIPTIATYAIVGATTVATAGLLTGPVLGAIGFTAAGPAAGKFQTHGMPSG